jgi:hypothetical protein
VDRIAFGHGCSLLAHRLHLPRYALFRLETTNTLLFGSV